MQFRVVHAGSSVGQMAWTVFLISLGKGHGGEVLYAVRRYRFSKHTSSGFRRGPQKLGELQKEPLVMRVSRVLTKGRSEF